VNQIDAECRIEKLYAQRSGVIKMSANGGWKKHDSNNNAVKSLIKLKYFRIERYRTIKS